MDEEQKYKLITCVDPRKINVPIRDRFAKLTLSNKKKQVQMADAKEGDLERDMEPDKRVSRNLMETLDNAIGNDSIKCVPLHENLGPAASTLSNLDMPYYVNPLLRSESSGSIPITQSCLNHEREDVQSEEMQPLQVSNLTADDNLLDSEIATLTKRVSVMAVTAKDLN
ncbi:PREDICTED: uncharacterized protein LOC108379111, partial [Rhagoletis zephyria]|uniref:uncharacterized protein LOC108379111 n=1 Tax=Rhagoletis zephyria TaxID=28612 RepID=UPI00081148EB